MPTATHTSKRQFTIPAEPRVRLHLQPGDQLDFFEGETSELGLVPRKRSLDDFFGILHSSAAPFSVEEMDQVIGEAVTETGLS